MFIQIFVDREDELSFLNENFESKKPFFIVLYGRRRVGKTELIMKFMEKRKGIYLLATQEVEKDIISSFSEDVAEFFNDPALKINPFSTFKQLIEYIKVKSAGLKERIVIVIDEFPYLVDANRAVPSIIQKYWDLHLKNSNVGLILCGSSISSMESEVLGSKSPLYGRRTGQWNVKPLQFKALKDLFKDTTIETRIEYYSITGSIPLYLGELDESKTVAENIREKIAKKGKFLYDEVEFLLKEELREPKTYASILKAIAFGNRRLNEISLKMGVERTLLTRYLETLESLEVIEREYPVLKKQKGRDALYRIKDNYFRFWFRFILPFKKDIEMNRYVRFNENIEHNINSFIGQSFEDICIEFLQGFNDRDKLPFSFTKIGRQWGKFRGERGRNTYEIDIVALNEDTKDIAFFECKWKELRRDDALKIIDELKEKAGYVRWNNDERKEYFGIIGKTVEGKDALMKDGYLVFDLRDF